jgi:CRP-like cAMP-binding protein
MAAERYPTVGRMRFSWQGEAADTVFYIHEGKIKIVVTSEQGKEAIVAILGPGEFFGEGCLIAQPLRLATATALVETMVMRESRDGPRPPCRADLWRDIHGPSADPQESG